jgi:hypothetical protein
MSKSAVMTINRGGRPSKLTPAVQARIRECLARGSTRVDAATQGGIDCMMLRRWERRGRRQKNGKFRRFCEAAKRAESDAVESCVATIPRAATEHAEVTVKTTEFPDGTVKTETTTRKVFEWTPATWWLERIRASDFGKKESTEFAATQKQLDKLRKPILGTDAARGGKKT